MTTIVVKDGIVAADSQMTTDQCMKQTYPKVHRVQNKAAVVAFCGDIAHGMRFVTWFGDNRRRKPFADVEDKETVDFEAVVAYESGAIEIWGPDMVPLYWPPDQPVVLGSGSIAALAALKSGASAREAVEVAAQVDPFTGGDVLELAVNSAAHQLTG